MIDGRPSRKLLILASDLAPSPSVGRLRVQKFCKYLPQFFWQARVVTFDVRYGSDRRLLAELPPELAVDRVRVPAVIDGLIDLAKVCLRRPIRIATPAGASGGAAPPPTAVETIDRASCLIERVKKFLARHAMIPDEQMLAIHAMAAKAVNVIRRWNPDALLVSVPGFSPFVAAAIAQQRTSVPLVADYRDLWHGDVLREWIGPVRSRLELLLERQCLRRCQGVVAVSKNYLAEVTKLAGPTVAGLALTNGFDRDDFPPPVQAAGREGRSLQILHAGRLFKNRTADALMRVVGELKAAGKISAADIHLTFLGDVEAAQMARLAAIIAQFSLADMVEFRPYVTRAQCLALEATADCLLVIGNEGAKSAGTMSMKLFECAGAARPVLALLNEGEGREFVQRSGIGRCAGISDPPAIAATLEGLVGDWRAGKALSAPNTVFLADYDFRNIAGRLAAFLDRLAGTP